MPAQKPHMPTRWIWPLLVIAGCASSVGSRPPGEIGRECGAGETLICRNAQGATRIESEDEPRESCICELNERIGVF